MVNINSSNAQLRIEPGLMVSYLVKNKTPGNRPGFGLYSTISYLYKRKNSGFAIEPSLGFAVSRFANKILPKTLLHIEQHSLHLNLRGLLYTSRSSMFTLGIHLDYLIHSVLEISETYYNERSYIYHNDPYLMQGYEPNLLKAALSGGFGKHLFKSRVILHFSYLQHVSPLVLRDYEIQENGLFRQKKILSARAWPGFVRMSVSIPVIPRRKAKPAESPENE